MKTDTLIIGGGLAGLALARRLNARGRDWQLIEARSRWGGRILTHKAEGQHFDLGPAWFWPGQPRILELTEKLGLSRFDQAYKGNLVYEDEHGRVDREKRFASMQGSWRLAGGFTALIDELVNGLPTDRLHLLSPLMKLTKTTDGILAETSSGKLISADRVVLAIPPRVAAKLIFEPVLPVQIVQTLEAIPTWMGGHAKVLALYEAPFWKDAGLSGDAMSRRGPMIEVHDASPALGGPYALFGFLGVPPQIRKAHKAELKEAIIAQFDRLFGAQAALPLDVILQDWAYETETATSLDHAPSGHHPIYGHPDVLENLWNNQLHFGSTEMGQDFGGYLEGALEVADKLDLDL